MFFLCAALAGNPDGPDWTITVDPLTTALGYVHVQTERRLGSRASLYAGPHMRLFDGLLSSEREPYIGIGGELGFRYFPWGRSPEGAWVMARTVLARVSTTEGPKRNQPGGYTSVLVGYTGLIGDHFVLSGGAGLNGIYYGIEDYGTRGFFPALHTNLGVAF